VADDRTILRDLAKRYLDVCARDCQTELRELWRRHNSLKGSGRTPIHVRAFAWHEMPQSKCGCEDALLRGRESFFRRELFRATFDDDTVFEPWVTVRARHARSGWGLSPERTRSGLPGGSWKEDYPLEDLGDIEKLVPPRHEIDEEQTARAAEKLSDALGDVITVNVDRAPAWRMWSADISTDLHHLRGIENFMLDMIDNPEWLHRLAGFMGDGVLRAHDEAEAAGDWGLSAHENQSMPYAEELPDPAANRLGAKRSELWGYMAAQEFTLVSPAMHEEFLLRYQLPILEKFGLVAYGCCEDLTRKIGMLRNIPNLRRIAVAPAADVARCAEEIGTDYVVSYRPSPADMVGYGFDPERVRTILRRDLEACRGCHVDITLKDVQTVQGDTDRVRRWVAIAREVAEEALA
jgi:hypothetical protein